MDGENGQDLNLTLSVSCKAGDSVHYSELDELASRTADLMAQEVDRLETEKFGGVSGQELV